MKSEKPILTKGDVIDMILNIMCDPGFAPAPEHSYYYVGHWENGWNLIRCADKVM